MDLVDRTRMSQEEFLAWEVQQVGRHEFIAGEVYAMAGATNRHQHITGNVYVALRRQFAARGCLAFQEAQLLIGDDLVYPDVVVTCEPDALQRARIERPVLIVEVLSPSTEAYDRGAKWTMYHRRLPSLSAYLLVSQQHLHVDRFHRHADGWHYDMHAGPEAIIELSDPSCRITLAEIYDGLVEALRDARPGLRGPPVTP